MTDDHSATARRVIADCFDNSYGDPDDWLYIADNVIKALTSAGYTITRRDPAAGRVCVDRDRIGYDEGFNAFKRFVLEEYRPDWEPGDWQIIAEAVWSAINAAIAAGVDKEGA